MYQEHSYDGWTGEATKLTDTFSRNGPLLPSLLILAYAATADPLPLCLKPRSSDKKNL